jgi:hypothetical protein
VPSQGNLLDWADKALGQGISIEYAQSTTHYQTHCHCFPHIQFLPLLCVWCAQPQVKEA